MSQPHSGSKTPGQRNGYSYCWSKYKHYATVFLLEVKPGRLCGHMSRLKYSTVVSYPELCSCACRVGAHSPERTSTGTPPPCWYTPGCSSLLRHTRPHLERTQKDRVMLASNSRRVSNEFKTHKAEKVKNSFILLEKNKKSPRPSSCLHLLNFKNSLLDLANVMWKQISSGDFMSPWVSKFWR